jgi:hypothetical protein
MNPTGSSASSTSHSEYGKGEEEQLGTAEATPHGATLRQETRFANYEAGGRLPASFQ